MTTVQHIIIALLLPTNVPALIAYARSVVAAMKGNANFPTPTIPLDTVSKCVDALETAQAKVGDNKRAAQDRNQKKATVRQSLRHLADYVAAVAEQAPADHVDAIIESAHMHRKRIGTRARADYRVVQGPISGSVQCEVKSRGRTVTYHHFFSTDGKTWVHGCETHKTLCLLTGLTPGQTYYFRYQALVDSTMSDPSQPVSLLVH